MSFLLKYKIKGHSMEPILKNGDEVLASSIPYIFVKPKVGDLVVFKKNGTDLIKRIIKIENNLFLAQGDNKIDSLDSRKLGAIKLTDIIAKVIYKL